MKSKQCLESSLRSLWDFCLPKVAKRDRLIRNLTQFLHNLAHTLNSLWQNVARFSTCVRFENLDCDLQLPNEFTVCDRAAWSVVKAVDGEAEQNRGKVDIGSTSTSASASLLGPARTSFNIVYNVAVSLASCINKTPRIVIQRGVY